MEAQQPLPHAAPAPDVTFCVRSDLCSPPAEHVLHCVWHADCSVDIELVNSQAVWRKQGVRRPDVLPISDAEWLRRAREVLGEGRHACEVVSHTDSPKLKWRWVTDGGECVSGSGALSVVCPPDVHGATFAVAVAAAQAARSHAAETAVLRGRLEAALNAAAGAERLVAQAVAAKEDAERTLCVRFAHLLNAQKEKYRAVAEELDNARARLGDGDGGTSDDEAGGRTQETTREAYDSRGAGLGDASGGPLVVKEERLPASSQGAAQRHIKAGGGSGAAQPSLLAKVMASQPPESQGTQAASPMKRAAAAVDPDDDLAVTRPRKRPQVSQHKKPAANLEWLLASQAPSQAPNQAPHRSMDLDGA